MPAPAPTCGSCGHGAMSEHCPGDPRCAWRVCNVCGGVTDRSRLTDDGRPWHTHHSLKPEHCLICYPV